MTAVYSCKLWSHVDPQRAVRKESFLLTEQKWLIKSWWHGGDECKAVVHSLPECRAAVISREVGQAEEW